ncbi:MAG TPA: diacylglycerol kinase family protein, partial [Myxococcota bacterium]|nr:diacylglycerol kinase family protein [Myxococcota bacterium]
MSVLAKDNHGAKNRGERLVVVANPRSAGGRTGADRDRVERAVFRAFEQAELCWTEGPGHASELARLAASRADIVAALGGDGTCHEVVNGLFSAGKAVNPKVIFTVLPSGTGGDLKRSLQIPARLEDSLWNAATGMTLPLDVGQVLWEDAPQKVFINVAGFGANAEVCRRANQSSKRWGGQA